MEAEYMLLAKDYINFRRALDKKKVIYKSREYRNCFFKVRRLLKDNATLEQ